jgi:hypothetical protein
VVGGGGAVGVEGIERAGSRNNQGICRR